MLTVCVKDEFCYSNFECFEKCRVSATGGGYHIPLIVVVVHDPTKKLLVKVNVVDARYYFNLKVTHNPSKKAKTYNTSLIRSLPKSSKRKKRPSSCFPNSLVQYHHEGHNGGKIQSTRKKPPHEFYLILLNEVGHVEPFHSHEEAGVSAVPVAIFKMRYLLHQGVYYDRVASCGTVAVSPSASRG